MQLQTFSTDQFPPHHRLQHWNDFAGMTMTPQVSDPLQKHTFTGRMASTDLGPIRCTEIYSDPAIIRHSRRHVALEREPNFLMCLQLDGVSDFRQNGREAVLEPGDFTVLDSALPYEVMTNVSHKLLVLGFPHRTLQRYVANPSTVVGVRMAGDLELSGLVSSFIRNFWHQYCNRLDAVLQPKISAAILDLVGSVYALVPQAAGERSTSSVIWQVRIRDYIESHFLDPELTPARIATALGISTRYLHQLFDDDDETLAKYILNRRLEECARALTDPTQRCRSVMEIALSRGFNNPSHFGRVFRDRYGLTPREYRNARDPSPIVRSMYLT